MLDCLTTVLLAQDQIVWTEQSTLHTFQIILSFVVHERPKVLSFFCLVNGGCYLILLCGSLHTIIVLRELSLCTVIFLHIFLELNNFLFQVRKAAQNCVKQLLKLNLVNYKSHPIGPAVAKFCIKVLQQHTPGGWFFSGVLVYFLFCGLILSD